MAPPPPKPCIVCDGESCFVIPSIVSHRHLCMLHYYATGAHRGKDAGGVVRGAAGMRGGMSSSSSSSSSSLYADRRRLGRQLPVVRGVFAEAFLELQRDIGEEMARSFRSASTSDDPLASLLNPNHDVDEATTRRPFRRRRHRGGVGGNAANDVRNGKSSAKYGHDTEGGFLREVVLPDRLRRLRHPCALDDYVESTPDPSLTGSGRRPLSSSDTTTATTTGGPSNPYRRKQKPPINVWNRVLDDAVDCRYDERRGGGDRRPTKTKWEELEWGMTRDVTSSGNDAYSKLCPCGSKNVRVEGSVTSRNSDMMKGEVWGMKDRGGIVIERCHCLACGRTLNEE